MFNYNIMKNFPNYKQLDSWDCGPTSLKIIAQHFGNKIDIEKIRREIDFERIGVSLNSLESAAAKIGFDHHSIMVTFDDLKNKAPLPCICHWEQNHFLVVYKIKKDKVFVSDPGKGKYTLSIKEFLQDWSTNSQKGDEAEGIAMLLEPNELIGTQYISDGKKSHAHIYNFFFRRLLNERKVLYSLVFGLAVAGILQVLLPIMTQSIVDQGIFFQDRRLIWVLIIGQLFFLLINFLVEIVRKWILLFLSMKLNLQLMESYLSKLLSLPISFLQRRAKGDVINRINDSNKVESFLTKHLLDSLYDATILIVLSILLFIYSPQIFGIFIVGSLMYVLWISLFMKRRAILDHESFGLKSKGQGYELQLISNIADIKTSGSENRRKKEWYENQLKIIKTKTKSLKLQNAQENLADIIRSSVNIFILLISALAVVDGTMTLGTMLAIQFILAQTNIPLNRSVDFMLELQETNLAMSRLSEVFREEPEDISEMNISLPKGSFDIVIDDISFGYLGQNNSIFNGLSLTIPSGKTTAIVGASGSGKTTLFRLILGFREPSKGRITLGGENLNQIGISDWRKRCGTVLQDGKIFDDSIIRNITESNSNEKLNELRLKTVLKCTKLDEMVSDLPNGLNTRVGEKGILLSGGEIQKVLIARALYKDPDFLFMDEATSALDATNESEIKKNLNHYLKEKTVVIIAHRLSTVVNADQIIVMDKGKVIEKGNHIELMKIGGNYSRLIKNQLGNG
ncbi:peptidase domain-containing ABC transporter [Maribacter sp. ACAM166]|nr:peptidase domain-containing ABC transporter [Maribacter sp. ACAM166]